MFESFGDFLAMGGYGGYVWPSYAICFGLLLLLTIQSVQSWKRRRQQLDALQASRRRSEPAGAEGETVA